MIEDTGKGLQALVGFCDRESRRRLELAGDTGGRGLWGLVSAVGTDWRLSALVGVCEREKRRRFPTGRAGR